jgi:hypothetical protein
MDIQKLIDAINENGRMTRNEYHLTLGGLRGALSGLDDDAPVVVDRGGGIGREMSYRGYYDDLSFEPVEASTVKDVRAACERASTGEYEGYKGGEYRYGDDTPLWIAPYSCTGSAIIAAVPFEGGIRLITKDAQ